MNKYCIGLMLILFLYFSGCQMVQTENGKEYQVDSRVTNAVHSTTHALDIPVKFICDVAGRVCNGAGEIVGVKPKETPAKTEKQLANEESWRVGGAIVMALLAL